MIHSTIHTLNNDLNATVINDNRFAVINGELIDIVTYDFKNGTQKAVISVYDATDCCNASHSDDLAKSFDRDAFIESYTFDDEAEAVAHFSKLIADKI